VLKYTIKLEGLIKWYNCFVAYYVRCVVGIYSVWIVFCNGVVAVNKIAVVGVFYIAWLGVALKLYGSAWECGLFVCDLYCRSLFIPLLCYLLVLVTICEDHRRYNMLLHSVCIFIIYCYLTHYLLVYGCSGYSGNYSQLFCCRILHSYYCGCRSEWPRGLSRRSAAARLLRSWVRILLLVWMFVCYECFVLSGIGLSDKLTTRPEESYRLSCVVVCDLETSRMRRPWAALGRSATKKLLRIAFSGSLSLRTGTLLHETELVRLVAGDCA
jgi:hypothetical protein